MVFHAMHVNGFLRGGSGGGGGTMVTDLHDSAHCDSSVPIKSSSADMMMCGDHQYATIASTDRLQREPLLKHDAITTMLMEDDGDDDDHKVESDCGACASGSTKEARLDSGKGLEYKDTLSNDNDVLKINLGLPPLPIRAESKFPKEKCKTGVAFAFAMSAAMSNSLTLAIVHERLPDPQSVAPLPDLMFDLLSPKRDWAMDVSEVLLIFSLAAMFTVTFLHKHRFIVLRRAFLIFGILYLMRAVSMLVTQVPASSTSIYCAPKANSTSPVVVLKRMLELTSGLGMSINGHQNYCGDYIFSGHTVTLTLCYLIIQEYTPRRCVLLHWLSCATSFTAAVLLLVAHAHYTIDILLAYYVTTRVFYVYHTMANNMDLKTPGSTNYLTRVWWFCIFDYFERNVKDRVPLQYEWPSSSWRTRRFAKDDRNS